MTNIEKIFIDLDEEITFVIERIRASKKQNVLIIVPDRAALISSVITLKLLFRHCFKTNKSLILVTTDDIGLRLARKADILTYQRVSDLDDDSWNKARKITMDKISELDEKEKESIHTFSGEKIAITQVDDADPTLADLVEEGSVAQEYLPSDTMVEDLSSDEVNELEGKQIVEEDEKSDPKPTPIIDDAISDDRSHVSAQNVEKPEMKTQMKDSDQIDQLAYEKPNTMTSANIRNIGGFEFLPGGDIALVKEGGERISPKEDNKEEDSMQTPRDLSSRLDRNPINPNDNSSRALGGSVILSGAKNLEESMSAENSLINNQDSSLITSAYAKAPADRQNSIAGRDVTGLKFNKRSGVDFKSIMTKFSSKRKPISSTTREPRKPRSFKFNYKYLLAILILLLVGVYYAYSIAPGASLSLKIPSKTINISKEVKASPAQKFADVQKLLIPATEVGVEVSSSKTADSTGTKIRGENAKGEVTIFNKTNGEVSLGAGTIISLGNLQYTLDSSITIPSKSLIDDGSGEVYGTRDITVTATTFGEAHNVAEKSEFVITGYGTDQLISRTFKGLSGGTTETIKIVSDDDIEKLKVVIQEELKPIAIEKLKLQMGDKVVFLEDSIKFEVIEVTPSPASGEEGSKFDLSVKAKAIVTAFDKNTVDELGSDLIKAEVPEGFEIIKDSIRIQSSTLRTEGEDVVVKIDATANSTKSFNEDDVRNAIAGRSESKAKAYLDDDASISGYTLTISPDWLFGPFKRVSATKSKLTIRSEFVEKATPVEEVVPEVVE